MKIGDGVDRVTVVDIGIPGESIPESSVIVSGVRVSRDISARTGDRIVRAVGRTKINGVTRKVVSAITFNEEFADDGAWSKTLDELFVECEAAVRASVAKLDEHAQFLADDTPVWSLSDFRITEPQPIRVTESA